MRTISVLIAATFCAFALSGSAFAVDRTQGSMSAPTPGWLEFRTAFAAERLWPGKVFTTKSGRAQSLALEHNALWPAALKDTASSALQHALDVLRNWRRAAERALTTERSSFDIAGN